MYDIVKYEDENGRQVSFTKEDVTRVFCQRATPMEVDLFMALCQTQELDPWRKDVYLVKYGDNPAQMVVGRDVFRRRAWSASDFLGIEEGVVVLLPDGSIARFEGEGYYPVAGQKLLGGWARVHRKDKMPYYAEVSLDEYDAHNRQWKRMPGTMIVKVAEGHALRSAYPAMLGGMYTQEELGKSTYVEATVENPAEERTDAPAAEYEDVTYDATAGDVEDLVGRMVAAGYVEAESRSWIEGIASGEGIDGATRAVDDLLGSNGSEEITW